MSHLQYSDYEGFGEQARKESHYSQAVRIGDTIEISGQGGWDRALDGTDISSDLGQEIDQTFANVEKTLKKAGGKGWEQVYKLRTYSVALGPDDLQHLIRNLRKCCPNHQPIWTAIGVQALAVPQMNIEVEVYAHLGS